MISFSLTRMRSIGILSAIVCLVSVAANGSVLAQSTPVTQDKKSDGPFVGIALVTDNLEWYKLFERPAPPQITGKERFAVGESGAIAVIFAGAAPRNNRVLVTCAVTAIQPDKSRQSFPPGVCYDGPARPEGILYPSLLDINFKIGESDPRGIAGFAIEVHDEYSGRSVTLRVSLLQDTAI